MKIKHPDIKVPKHIQSLPMSDNGYHKPWFVAGDDFRVVDNDKAQIANAKKACWLCGNPFEESRFALVCSPLSAMTRIFREPPCHVDCAQYAMQVCPFIIYPNSKRRVAGLSEEDTLDYINRDLEVKQSPDNPGEFYLLVVDDFYVDSKSRTLRCDQTNVIETQHWIQGKMRESHPIPIVPYEKLPEEMQSEMDKLEFLRRFGNPKESGSAQVPDYKRVTHTAFQGKFWVSSDDYRFTATDTVVPIGAQELTIAVHHLPTAFIQSGDQFQLVVILGLPPNKNMMLTPEGAWRGNYVPTVYTCYPFKLGSSANQVDSLIIDMNSGLVVDADSFSVEESAECNSFYVAEDQFSEELLSISARLSEISEDQIMASKMTSVLAKHTLLKPWPIRIRIEQDSQERIVSGLFSIDESRLNKLGSSEIIELRDSGALLLAYCQLLSMKHLRNLT